MDGFGRVFAERVGGRRKAVRATLLLTIATLVTVLCAVPAAGVTAAAPGQVTVTVTVRPTITTTFSDGGVLVRSSIPWQLSADVPGSDRVEVSGGPTSGSYIELPEAAYAIEVYAR